MPVFDLQSKLGINVDKWLMLQSQPQPFKHPAMCHVFEKEWVECAHGIGETRARKECVIELEDFKECMSRAKSMQRMHAVLQQKKKLMKEGKYTPPYMKNENES